jgi:hypothetical protein
MEATLPARHWCSVVCQVGDNIPVADTCGTYQCLVYVCKLLTLCSLVMAGGAGCRCESRLSVGLSLQPTRWGTCVWLRTTVCKSSCTVHACHCGHLLSVSHSPCRSKHAVDSCAL